MSVLVIGANKASFLSFDKYNQKRMVFMYIYNVTKADKDLIVQMNKTYKTGYRVKSYDLGNVDDLIEMAKAITAEYLNYNKHVALLDQILEEIDETLETFRPASWYRLSSEMKIKDPEAKEVIKGMQGIQRGTNTLHDISEIMRGRMVLFCGSMIKHAPDDFFTELGLQRMQGANVSRFLEFKFIFENIEELSLYSVEDTFSAFISVVNREINAPTLEMMKKEA